MLKFTQLLTPETILQGVVCSSKKRVFESISRIVAKQLGREEQESAYFDCLFNREKLGNSGLGNGVAMPKGRLVGMDKAIAVFLQLNLPVEYESADNREVDLVFALFVPPESCESYSQELPKLAERLLDKSLCKQLRAAQNEEEIWQLLEMADNVAERDENLEISAVVD